MPKSQYPNNYDTSKELPPVRDNITEISGDLINSLRSAIIQIERTLGINPQGSIGNTVATRLGAVIDERGNLKASAITQAGILSGPIHNSDVSESAAILEKKLRLDFPTRILQTEISQLQKEIDEILVQLRDLIARFSAHVNTKALDRHKAISITVEENSLSPSSIGTKTLSESSLQDFVELLYNSHINYTGSDISSVNNSHLAKQIYFDNSDVTFTDKNDLQGAVEDLGNIQSDGLRDSILNLNSNGRIRTGNLISNYEDRGLGLVIAGPASVTYNALDGSNKTTFSFGSAITPSDTVSRYDTFTLSGSVNSDDNRSYLISDITVNGSGDILSISVFGAPLDESQAGLTGIITKSSYRTYNPNGLNATVRPKLNKSNTPVIQLAHPAAATIITSGLEPSRINSTTRYFNISIDGGTAITVDVYDSTVSEQTRNSILNKINQAVIAQNYNFLAYPIVFNNCDEIAIAHSIPDMSGDTVARTLTISSASSGDASSELGFSDILDLEIAGDSGHSFHINGLLKDNFEPIVTYTSSDVQFSFSTFSMTSNSGSFFSDGLKAGQIVVITGSPDDDGTYYIESISSETITLESANLAFTSQIDSNTKIFIYDLGANIGELNFDESTGSSGSILFDVIVDENLTTSFNKRLETDLSLSSGSYTAIITDVSRNFIVKDETAILNISTTGYATLVDPLGQTGAALYVGEKGSYKIYSADKLSYIQIYVKENALPTAALSSNIYGYTDVSSSVLHTCRGTFSTELGIILGEDTGVGIPVLKDKRKTGTIDETIISETFIERYIEGPRNELVSSGVISGCSVSNISFTSDATGDYYTFDIASGIALVNGRRLEFSGKESVRFNASSSDNFYIVLNEYGCLEVGLESTTFSASGKSPFIFRNVANLARVEGDASSPTIYSTRIFIDRNTLKVANKIIVSPEPHAGHFETIQEAVDYCRQGTRLYQNDIIPTIWLAPGEHEVSETIFIDFDICIEGSGLNSIIKRASTFISGKEPAVLGTYPNEFITFSPENSVFMIGQITEFENNGNTFVATRPVEGINRGVTFKNFTYQGNDSMTNVLTFCEISQVIQGQFIDSGVSTVIDYSTNAAYRFENINFYGPSTIRFDAGNDQATTVTTSESIGEFFLGVGTCIISANGIDAPSSPLLPAGIWGEYFSGNQFYGNIFVKNCFIKNSGIGQGCLLFRIGSRDYYNVIISENMNISCAPGQTNIVPSVDLIYSKIGTIGIYNFEIINNIEMEEDIV